jgi:hypothetical protein
MVEQEGGTHDTPREQNAGAVTPVQALRPARRKMQRHVRGSRGGDVAIERRGRDPEAVRDLRHADVRIGQHRLGGLDVVVGEFGRTAASAARAPSGSEARLGALPDQAALKFC